MKYLGSCHCGTVKFEVEAPKDLQVDACNCSICSKSGFLHLIVPKSKFSLVQGKEALSTYRFNTGIAQHLFCQICGVKPFYIPRSNPDGYDINVRCLDTQPDSITVVAFDGVNWEQNAHKVAHKSQENSHTA